MTLAGKRKIKYVSIPSVQMFINELDLQTFKKHNIDDFELLFILLIKLIKPTFLKLLLELNFTMPSNDSKNLNSELCSR